MYEWIIIGGGIHGCCIANHLVENRNISKENILIIDQYSQPLSQWLKTTNLVGMKYLRSPFVHQIGVDPLSLKHYSKDKDYASAFKGEFKRPKLDMFNQHCIDTIKQNGVVNMFKKGTVNQILKKDCHWKISLLDGSILTSTNVILSIGVNHAPYYPEWARKYKSDDNIQHIFEMEDPIRNKEDIVIIGGGMSAAHLACTLCAEKSNKKVTLIKRHPFRIHSFDSDPGWLGPKYLNQFHKESDYTKRRKMIKGARHRGSITKDLSNKIKKLHKNNQITIHTANINDVTKSENSFKIHLDNHTQVNTQSILLATGATNELPGKSWIYPLIKQMHLPCAPCGFPITSKYLEWTDGLYVSGALAELEIGPSSRNIAGAKKAAERILMKI